MKRLNGYRKRLMLVGFVAAIMLGGGSAKADFTFGEPINMGPTINSERYDYNPVISSDGLELYFYSSRPGGYEGFDFDIYVSTRASANDDWGIPVSLGSTVNGPDHEYMPRLSPDGLELYFDADREGGYGSWDTWLTRRATKDSAWGPPENFGPPVNTSGNEGTVWITNDGLELYFCSDQPGGYCYCDLYVSTRATTEDDWGNPVNLGPTVNSSGINYIASVTADGLALFIMEDETEQLYRDDGFGTGDIWITTRPNRSSPWGVPVNLGPIINTPDYDSGGFVSPDGTTFYFDSRRPDSYGGSDLYQAPIIPIVDFNADGIVDALDICIMVDHWGENYSLCDIGPMPWGDDIVDVQDLIVLAEHLFEEIPPAESTE